MKHSPSRGCTWCAGALVALVLLVLLVFSIQDLQYRECVFGRNDWKESAAVLMKLVRSNDVILTGYDGEILLHYATNLPCPVVHMTGDFNGKDITLDQVRQYQRQYERVWCTFVNSYFRWGGGERVSWMDRQFVLIPHSVNIHYWARREAEAWSDPDRKRQSEIELLQAALAVTPWHYRTRRQLAQTLFDEQRYAESVAVWKTVLAQYLLDPWNYQTLGICYRDGLGGATNTLAAALCFRCMYWVARMQTPDDTEPQVAALRGLCETYRLQGAPKRMLALIPAWEKALLSSGTADNNRSLEHLRIETQRDSAARQLGTAAAAPNLLPNGAFAHGLAHWLLAPDAQRCSGSVAVVQSGVERFIRISNPSGYFAGVSQVLDIASGEVYRVSGMARSALESFDGRIAVTILNTPRRYVIDWYGTLREWVQQTIVFSNDADARVEVAVLMGVLNHTSCGDFADIRLENLRHTNAVFVARSVAMDAAEQEQPAYVPETNYPPLIKNGDFTGGFAEWTLSLDARRHPNSVTVGQSADGQHYLRIQNPAGAGAGVEQYVPVFSGKVYRLSGMLRAAHGRCDGRIVLNQRAADKCYRLDWYEGVGAWAPQALVFTNTSDCLAQLSIQMGFFNISCSADFAQIRFEQLK